MKVKYLLIACLSVLSVQAVGQQLSLDSFNVKKQQLTSNGMKVLGSWGAANLAYGAIARANATGSNKYFHEMNMFWGGINAGLATLGYLGSRKKQALDGASTLRSQGAVEKTFLFNTALDIAYIAGGFYVKEKSKNTAINPDRLKGYGNSIVLQGAALMLFDGVMYFVHNRHGKQLLGDKFQWQLAATGNGIGLVVGW